MAKTLEQLAFDYATSLCAQITKVAMPTIEYSYGSSGTVWLEAATGAGLGQQLGGLSAGRQLNTGGIGSVLITQNPEIGLTGTKNDPWAIYSRFQIPAAPAATTRFFPLHMNVNGNVAGAPPGGGGMYFGLAGPVSLTNWVLRVCNNNEANAIDRLSATAAPIGRWLDGIVVYNGWELLPSVGQLVNGSMTLLSDIIAVPDNNAVNTWGSLIQSCAPGHYVSETAAGSRFLWVDNLAFFTGHLGMQ